MAFCSRIWWCCGGKSYQWRVQDLEEEHPFSVRPGDDPRPGVAQPHCPVAAWCHKVSLCKHHNQGSFLFLEFVAVHYLHAFFQAWRQRLQCAQASAWDTHLRWAKSSCNCKRSAPKWRRPVWCLALWQRKRRWEIYHSKKNNLGSHVFMHLLLVDYRSYGSS